MTGELRYVVLHHTGIDQPHYDLMIETAPGSALATWRLPNWPPQPGDEFTPLAEHRREYLEYEGEVSGGRGIVRRIDFGMCRFDRLISQCIAILDGNHRLILPCRPTVQTVGMPKEFRGTDALPYCGTPREGEYAETFPRALTGAPVILDYQTEAPRRGYFAGVIIDFIVGEVVGDFLLYQMMTNSELWKDFFGDGITLSLAAHECLVACGAGAILAALGIRVSFQRLWRPGYWGVALVLGMIYPIVLVPHYQALDGRFIFDSTFRLPLIPTVLLILIPTIPALLTATQQSEDE